MTEATEALNLKPGKFVVDADEGSVVLTENPEGDHHGRPLKLPDTAKPGNYLYYLDPYGNPVYAQVRRLSRPALNSLSTGSIGVAISGEVHRLTPREVIGIHRLLPAEAETFRQQSHRIAFDLTTP